MNIEERAAVNPSPRAEGHIRAYLASDGRDVNHPAGDGLILLYTTGRTSGEIKRTPLGSVPEDGALVIIAAHGGRPKTPQWYLNLVADARVWVRKQSDFYEAEASVLPKKERDLLWDKLSAQMPVLVEYQESAGREIPLVRLRRVES